MGEAIREQAITCPSCGKKIPLTRALRAEIETSVKEEYERQLREEVERARQEAADEAEKKAAKDLEQARQMARAVDALRESGGGVTRWRSVCLCL